VSRKKKVDRYAYWKQALGGNFVGWDHPDSPWDGFWRWRPGRSGLWEPVATFLHAGEPTALFERKSKSLKAIEVWMMCAFNPVTEEQYRHAVIHGNWWDSLLLKEPTTKQQFTNDVTLAEPIGPPPRRS
jgi:hypothetical protein